MSKFDFLKKRQNIYEKVAFYSGNSLFWLFHYFEFSDSFTFSSPARQKLISQSFSVLLLLFATSIVMMKVGDSPCIDVPDMIQSLQRKSQ